MTDRRLELLAEVDDLLVRYVDALDNKDMERWLDAFVDEERASYMCMSQENAEIGLQIGFMYDDCRARLKDRVSYITEVWAGTFQDYRTRHFVQRLSVDETDANTVSVRSNFTVFMTPISNGVSEVLATGTYQDIISVEGGIARLASRKALLDNSVLPRYLVYPI